MDSDLDHEFSPNSPPRGHYSDLGPKGAQKESKGAKRVPKDLKMIQNGAKRVPKSWDNLWNNVQNTLTLNKLLDEKKKNNRSYNLKYVHWL